jgi:glycosyltransferase involved in cell wall biosynthesis
VKITFVLPGVSENGGTRVVGIYAKKLLEMGHDVTVVSREPRFPPLWRRLVRQMRGHADPRPSPSATRFIDFLGSRHVRIGHEGPLRPEDVPDADVIIATWWRTAFEVAIMPPEKGAKVYFVQGHEVFPNLPYDLSAGSYYLPLRKIAVSQWLVDRMADLYGDTNVTLVPNGVDHRQFHAPSRAKNEHPTIGFIYSTSQIKGVDVALEALRLVRATCPDFRVMSFGTTEPAPRLPLPDGTVFHLSPDADTLRGAYASCDVWLSASRSEGFGLPLLEAMACRCPVVATRVGAAPDLIEPGVNGYLANVEDAETLAKALMRILSLSPAVWRQMSDAAHATASRHSWEKSALSFEAALHAIVRAG